MAVNASQKQFADISSGSDNYILMYVATLFHLHKFGEPDAATDELLDYYPWASDVPSYSNAHLYTQLDKIPVMEKMRSISKTLKIATEDGQKVITLENLGEQIIKKNSSIGTRSAAYFLEIFDYDLVGKPASEW